MPPSVDDVYWYKGIGDVASSVPPSSNLQGRVGRTTICKMEILSHELRARASPSQICAAPEVDGHRSVRGQISRRAGCAVWNWKSKI